MVNLTQTNQQLEIFDSLKINKKRRNALFIVSLGELLDGYDTLVISGALIVLTPLFHLSKFVTSTLGAITFIGAFFGMILFGNLSDKIGRKKVFLIDLIVFAGLGLLSALVANVTELIIIRFFIGVAIGADIPTSMAYLSEISPKISRARWGGVLPNSMWVVGALIASIAWYFLIPIGATAWRWVFGIGALVAVVVWVARRYIPESPRWLIENGKIDEGERVLKSFGLSLPAMEKGKEIKTTPKVKYSQLFTTWKYSVVVIAVCLLVLFNGIAGPISTILGPYLLRYIGLISIRSSLLYTIYIWTAALFGVVLGFTFVDKFSRRELGIVAGIIQGIFALLIAFLGKEYPIILLLSIMGFGVVNWAIAIPLIWLWGTELFPTDIRASGQGITNGVNRLAIAASSFIVIGGIALIGELSLMVIFALMMFAFSAVVFMFKRFDTRGKSLEEIT